MGSLYITDVLNNALANVGAVCGKTNEFSAELDSIDYFNTKKNGVANSCSIFQCDMAYRSTRDANLEPCPDKWDAYYFLYQPSNPKNNCGAGCTQQAGYFKNNDAWYQEPDACTGDWIFYTNDGGTNDGGETYYHVGLVVDWGDWDELGGRGGYKVVEGNTDGGYVAIHYVPFGDSRIGGFGRPRYDGWECPVKESEPEPKPTPNPGPEPKPEPTTYEYQVTTNGGILRLRSASNTRSSYLIGIPNGTILSVDAVVDGEEIGGDTGWLHTSYEGFTGYVARYWTTKL